MQRRLVLRDEEAKTRILWPGDTLRRWDAVMYVLYALVDEPCLPPKHLVRGVVDIATKPAG
jgi:hypothetical protein